ncbi:GNAT family N-acetyltransferase [Actinotalea sp. BY-33]|uniref:GNAT family N-acetyltransferase n=1 Tax=Actinotalea soli TaxID=2819234 RepID=A0A939LP34_9CELL|nr:GNAT family N-acetyltransferase [Actinotalea soli]MBO1750245.1 GNAT family N-acetyltransferase [Actinotalea soli]
MLELCDDRLLLTVPTEEDLDDITAACQDPEVARWTTVPAPYTREHARGFVRDMVLPGWEQGTSEVWALRGRATTRTPGDAPADLTPVRGMLGMVGLHGIADGEAELGYWTAPWARGQGLMTRAAAIVVEHAFADLDLVRLTWHAYVGNWPSRRVAWRLGFQVEGTLRAHGLQRGERIDSWAATLLRDDPRQPAEPWPAEAPADGRAVPIAASRRYPVPSRERMAR